MDMLTLSGIETSRYRNQFSLEMIGKSNATGTFFDDLDKVFFLSKIIPVNMNTLWNLSYESYNPDSRLVRTRIGFTGLLEFPNGQEIAVNKIILCSSISYLYGFYIRKR
jgi:hypothetical protein